MSTTYPITEFGATSSRNSEDTNAIQTAIDACAAEDGGEVVFPPGEYVSAPVFLEDNLTIRIEAGATVHGVHDFDAYPPVEGRWEGYEREVYASLFTGHDLTNVTITGRGTINAQGQPWWEAFDRAAGSHDLGRDNPYPSTIELEYPRPRVLNLYNSEDILVEGVTVRNSPSWTLHFVYCEDVTVRDVTIRNPFETPNTDGINSDSSQNVMIEGCDIAVGDDCIALKAGCGDEGRQIGKPCENIIVSNCLMSGGYSGLAIGSETSGDIRNVTLNNCIFENLLSGIQVKSKRGRGGVVKNLHCSSIVCNDLSEAVVELTMFYGSGDGPGTTESAALPTFSNFSFTDLLIANASELVSVTGLSDSPIRRISISKVNSEGLESLGTLEQTKHARFDDISDWGSADELTVTDSTNVQIINSSTNVHDGGCKTNHQKDSL